MIRKALNIKTEISSNVKAVPYIPKRAFSADLIP